MSTKTLCPQPELSCEGCVQVFLDEHPGVETWVHTYHYCDCPMIATPVGGGEDTCVGCGERRDLWDEFRRLVRAS